MLRGIPWKESGSITQSSRCQWMQRCSPAHGQRRVSKGRRNSHSPPKPALHRCWRGCWRRQKQIGYFAERWSRNLLRPSNFLQRSRIRVAERCHGQRAATGTALDAPPAGVVLTEALTSNQQRTNCLPQRDPVFPSCPAVLPRETRRERKQSRPSHSRSRTSHYAT